MIKDDKEFLEKLNAAYPRRQYLIWPYADQEFKDYLDKRFPEPFAYYDEPLYRIEHSLEEKPKCPMCGKPLGFFKNYVKWCSKTCEIKSRKKNKPEEFAASYRKAGESIKKAHDNATPEQKAAWAQKISESHKERFKRMTPEERELHAQHSRYVGAHATDNFTEEQYESWISKISEKAKAAWSQKSDIERAAIHERGCKTKKSHGHFISSIEEETLYVLLSQIYPEVLRQHSSEQYPYACDFYIPETDAWIEYNGASQHGKHPYDPNSEEDRIQLEKLQKTRSQKYVSVWTERDPMKRRCAADNNLNYIELWGPKDACRWLCNKLNISYKDMRKLWKLTYTALRDSLNEADAGAESSSE